LSTGEEGGEKSGGNGGGVERNWRGVGEGMKRSAVVEVDTLELGKQRKTRKREEAGPSIWVPISDRAKTRRERRIEFNGGFGKGTDFRTVRVGRVQNPFGSSRWMKKGERGRRG